ncbi:phosphate ABC transporter ATP-binding protein PstB [Candidatus Microgenomates bacterium]|nr:phosphate ABC transporter ATP-binding protein PstB [Candidatus Microgenomates bacterium]
MIISIQNLNLFYGNFQALIKVNLNIRKNVITSLIGPSGCGKTTLLRSLNRMNDLIEGVRIEGKVLYDGKDIYRQETDLIDLRRRVGMVFQRPNPFPLSIFDNVVYGPRVHGEKNRKKLEDIVQKALISVQLWGELKDKLHQSALSLMEEQQQRLCIARLLAVDSEVLLMDEPCSTLDPLATAKIEELLVALKKNYTIIIVTHNMQQAARISDDTGFFLLGEMVEFGQTGKIFTAPKKKRTEDYIEGRFG